MSTFLSSCKAPGSATSPCSRNKFSLPFRHRHHPFFPRLLGRSTRWSSTQGNWPIHSQRAVQIRCHQSRPRNPPEKDLPEQIRAPAVAGELSELPWGEAPQHATWHIGQLQAHGLEGLTPLGIAHGCLPNISNWKLQSSIVLEQGVVDPKAIVCAYQAQRPVVDKGGHTCPDPCPSPGIVTEDPDACTRASVLLEGE